MNQKFFLSPVFTIFFPLLLCGSPQAKWVETAGQKQEDFQCFVQNGPYLFAGSNFGLYRSENNGDTFKPVTTILSGHSEPYFRALAVKGGALFAATYYGLYRSTDEGETWSVLGDSALTVVTGLAVEGGNLFAMGEHSLYRSGDDGKTWLAVDSALKGAFKYSITATGQDLYVGVANGVFRSSDQGDSWTHLIKGFDNPPWQTAITELAASGAMVFGGTDGKWIFRSFNKGDSWMQVNTGLASSVIQGLAIVGTRIFAGTVVNGVYLSADTGSTWMRVNEGLTDSDVTAMSQVGDYLFVGIKGKGIAKRSLSDFATPISRFEQPGTRFGFQPGMGFHLAPGSQIGFTLNSATQANLSLYDLQGNLKLIMLNAELAAGPHLVGFRGDKVPPGPYILKLEADGMRRTRRVEIRK